MQLCTNCIVAFCYCVQCLLVLWRSLTLNKSLPIYPQISCCIQESLHPGRFEAWTSTTCFACRRPQLLSLTFPVKSFSSGRCWGRLQPDTLEKHYESWPGWINSPIGYKQLWGWWFAACLLRTQPYWAQWGFSRVNVRRQCIQLAISEKRRWNNQDSRTWNAVLVCRDLTLPEFRMPLKEEENVADLASFLAVVRCFLCSPQHCIVASQPHLSMVPKTQKVSHAACDGGPSFCGLNGCHPKAVGCLPVSQKSTSTQKCREEKMSCSEYRSREPMQRMQYKRLRLSAAGPNFPCSYEATSEVRA